MLLFSNAFMGQLERCPMEYDEEDNGAAGIIPEFGAIFMSSTVTKRECFNHNIFAMPSSQSEFVKHVKAGMVLFLFEFEKRRMFGVYQATSDGAMDILPHAFNYSGKHFPAQVRFTTLWSCHPLPEKDFGDAIRENYFSGKKFHFGLSETQVRRLLSLFNSRKLQNNLPPHLPTHVVVGAAGEDRDDSFAPSQRRYLEPNEYDEFNPAVLCDYRGNSLTRADEDELLMEGGGVYAEGRVYPLQPGFSTDYDDDSLAKRRRKDNENRLMMRDLEENGIYNNNGNLRSSCNDPPNDSLQEVRRLADVRRVLSSERGCNENQVVKNLNHPAHSSEYLMRPVDMRTAAGDRFVQRNSLLREYEMGNGFGQSFEREHHGDPLDKSKHESADTYLFDDVRDIVKPVVYGDGHRNLLAQARELTEDRHCSMEGKLERRYHIGSNGSPVSGFERSGSILDKLRNTTAGGRFLIDKGIESEPNFAHPFHRDHRIIHDGEFPFVGGRVSENMLDSIRVSSASNKNSEYISSVDGRVIDVGRVRSSERVVENLDDVHAFVSPTEYPYYSKPKQNLSSVYDKFLPETAHSQLTAARYNFDPSRSKFNDAIVTRADPYTPEIPNFAHGCSASLAADRNSNLVREIHPHHCSPRNHYSLSNNRSSPQFLESKNSGRYQDITPEYGTIGLPSTTSSHQNPLFHENTSSPLNSNLYMPKELNNSPPVNYRSSAFSRPPLNPDPSADRENIPFRTSENYFPHDGDLPVASQHMRDLVPREEMDVLAGEKFIRSESKDYSLGVYHQERDLASYENQYFKIPSNVNLKEQQKISEAPHGNRRSVFDRLTSGKEVKVGEEKKDTRSNRNGRYMDASADEVMEMLQQCNNLPVSKPRKSRVVGQPKHGESDLDEKVTPSHIEINHSTPEKKKLKDDDLATPETVKNEVLKETRAVVFKRRSETKKNLVETNTGSVTDDKKKNLVETNTGSVADDEKKNLVETNTSSVADDKITAVNEEVEGSTKNTLKRKKLVRPVFRKTEPATDDTDSSQNLRLLGQILHKTNKRSCERISNENSNVKEHPSPGEAKDIKHQTSNADVENGGSQVLHEETSIKGSSSKDMDATVSNLNPEESSPEVLKLGANCGNNLIKEEKRFSMSNNKRRIIRLGKTLGTQ